MAELFEAAVATGTVDVDVLIVGAGPAGMFAASRLLRSLPSTARLMLIDKGKPAAARSLADPLTRHPAGWETHDLVSGAGGAGLYSDGKLTLTLKAGNKLANLISDAEAAEYLQYIEQTLVSFDGVSVVNNAAQSEIDVIAAAAAKTGLTYKHLPVRHFGSDALSRVVSRFFDHISCRPNLQTAFQLNVVNFKPVKRGTEVYAVDPFGRSIRFNARFVVFALGKEGSLWLTDRLAEFGVASTPNRIYVGVRVETPALTRLFDVSFDPKLSMRFDDGTKMKTHCFCRHGTVLPLRYFGLPVAGSHTPFTEKQSSVPERRQTSVYGALLGDSPERRLSRDEILRLLLRFDRAAGGRLTVQRLRDFRCRRATTTTDLASHSFEAARGASPGDITSLDLPLEFDSKFAEFSRLLLEIDPGIVSDDALVYAPAIEWWMPRIETTNRLETRLTGVYVAGDGAGVSQGITAAATAGLIVADDIRTRY